MKKTILFILATAALLVSCQRERVTANEEPGSEIVLYASLYADDDSSKVAVSTQGKVTWTSGDKIAVYNTSGTKFTLTLSDGAGTNSGLFTGTFSGTPDVAVYPAEYASATKGTVSLPSVVDFTATPSSVPAVFAGKCSVDKDSKTGIQFKSISGLLELNMTDIPAYARGMKVQSISKNISGDFKFSTSNPTALNSTSGYSGVLFRFPYKTGYKADTKFYVPVPSAEYTDLKVTFIDGDEEPIEGVDGISIPAKSSQLTAGKYVSMAKLNVRSKVTRPSDVRKIEGVYWATGNLIRKSGVTGTGFQNNWTLAANQWEFLFSDKMNESGSSQDLNQETYNFDHFVWGVCGNAARNTTDALKPSASQNLQCKLYSDVALSKSLTPSEGFAKTACYGDLAFWASKGQWCMPNKSQIIKLRAGTEPTAAKGKAGYVMDNGHKIFGILYTSTSYEETTSLEQTAETQFTEADLESGLFMPKVGRRFNTDATGNVVKYIDNQGYYWSSTFNTLDGEHKSFENCATCLGYRLGNAIDYGYTTNINGTNVSDIRAGLAIRPVKLTGKTPDPEITPTSKSLEPWKQGELDIHFINSGRGECNFIIMPDGTTMMIDAGDLLNKSHAQKEESNYVRRKPSDDTNILPNKVYTTYMKYMMQNISHKCLDYFLLTHFHIDHLGSLSGTFPITGNGYVATGPAAIYEDFPIKKLVDRRGPSGIDNIPHREDDLNDELAANYAQFARYRQEKDGMGWYSVNLSTDKHDKQFPPKYDTGCSCAVSIIGANGQFWSGNKFTTYFDDNNTAFENNKSVTCLLTWGAFNAYFGGDCNVGGDQIAKLIAQYCGKVELYKASHHLVFNAYNEEVANLLKPKVTVSHCFAVNVPADPALAAALSTGDVFVTNCENDNKSRLKDSNGHFCVRVKQIDGVKKFWVYKLKDTDFSYEVVATYGPYSCH